MDPKEVALLCKALSDDNRLRIVQLLTQGEKCGCELLKAFKITQPTLSHHMKALCECGLVRVRRVGKWSHYSVNRETLAAFRQYIDALACAGGAGGGGET